MMNDLSEERRKQLEDLETFAKITTSELGEIISDLGWTVDSISNDNRNILTCPFDSAHRMSECSLEKHLEKCQWKAEGYDVRDLPLPEATVSPNAPSAIKFDESLLEEVLQKARAENPTMKIGSSNRLIPGTSDRLVADFTTDERRAIYDYVIANTAKPTIAEEIADPNKLKPQDGNSEKKCTFLELLAQERNLKRRRAKHRGVHTNKKSHIEILREAIGRQMEIYAEYVTDQQQDVSTTDDPRIESYLDESSVSDGRHTKHAMEALDTSSSKYSHRPDRDTAYQVNPEFSGKQRYREAPIDSELRRYPTTGDDRVRNGSGQRERSHGRKRRGDSGEHRYSGEKRERRGSRERESRRDGDSSREKSRSAKKHKSRGRDRSRSERYAKHDGRRSTPRDGSQDWDSIT